MTLIWLDHSAWYQNLLKAQVGVVGAPTYAEMGEAIARWDAWTSESTQLIPHYEFDLLLALEWTRNAAIALQLYHFYLMEGFGGLDERRASAEEALNSTAASLRNACK